MARERERERERETVCVCVCERERNSPVISLEVKSRCWRCWFP